MCFVKYRPKTTNATAPINAQRFSPFTKMPIGNNFAKQTFAGPVVYEKLFLLQTTASWVHLRSNSDPNN